MTHIDAPATAGPVPEHVSLKRWLAVVAVAVGTFLVVTAEQLPVGLLTPSAATSGSPRAPRA
jgi:predicted MFS family arabinose efflux permease